MRRSTGRLTLAVVGAALLLLFAAATALADGPKPTIESESASNITTTDATLEALVNPGSGEDGFALETTYEFFLESPWCGTYGPGFCEASGGVLVYKGTIAAGATTPQPESVDLAGAGHALAPGVTYGYRVVARNEVGEAFGGEKTFITMSSPCVEDPQDCTHPPGPTITPGPVSNEPTVPLAGGQDPTSGGSGSPPSAGDGAAAGVSSKPAHGKPTTKHGKRHKHKHHPAKGAKRPKPKKHG